MNVHKNFESARAKFNFLAPLGVYKKCRHTCHKFYIKSADSPKLLRPLRKFSRFEFFKFCEFWNLPIYPDLTNLNVRFQRNRLRLQSLPYLKNFFNLNLFKQIDQIQKMINFENEYFQLIIQKFFFPPPIQLKKSPIPVIRGRYCSPKAYNIFYFPKIFQYRLLHYFFFSMRKKLSFNEILCLFQKLNIKKK